MRFCLITSLCTDCSLALSWLFRCYPNQPEDAEKKRERLHAISALCLHRSQCASVREREIGMWMSTATHSNLTQVRMRMSVWWRDRRWDTSSLQCYAIVMTSMLYRVCKQNGNNVTLLLCSIAFFVGTANEPHVNCRKRQQSTTTAPVLTLRRWRRAPPPPISTGVDPLYTFNNLLRASAKRMFTTRA